MLSRRGLLRGLLAYIPLCGMKTDKEYKLINHDKSMLTPEKLKLDIVRFRVSKRYSCVMQDISNDISQLGDVIKVQIKDGDKLIFKWVTFTKKESCTLGLIDSFKEDGKLCTREYTLFNVAPDDFKIFHV